MTSSRPYLLRAIYEWLVDNQLTPYMMVEAEQEGVVVPKQFVENGRIVLNVSPQAVFGLTMGNEMVEFNARFSGLSHHVLLPIDAVRAIYSFENGRGMIFHDEEEIELPPTNAQSEVSANKDDHKNDGDDDDPPPSGGDEGASGDSSKRPKLRIVK